jgi:hypothetical protein
MLESKDAETQTEGKSRSVAHEQVKGPLLQNDACFTIPCLGRLAHHSRNRQCMVGQACDLLRSSLRRGVADRKFAS